MLQKVPIGMVRSSGAPESPIRVNGRKLEASSGEATAPSEIEEGFYDESSGTLTLKFSNGQTLNVKGFPTASSMPEGRQGARGEVGPAGPDGRDGRDGEVGEAGCDGPQGPVGSMGNPGKDGRSGLPGLEGLRGATGEVGERGPRGATGETGPTGATGPSGATGPTGATGVPGPPGQMKIIVSSVDPGPVSEGTVWVNPNLDQGTTWP